MEKQPPPYEMGHSNPQYSPYAPPPNQMGGPNNPYAPPPNQMGGPIYTQPAPAPAHMTSNSTSTHVVVNAGGGLGGCPVCHNNSWTGDYGCCAWLWCLLCFPVGIVCCLCMRRKKCTQCGYTVG